MQRNSGALASLTANYTDSDVSDSDEEKDEGKTGNIGDKHVKKQFPHSFRVTPIVYSQPSDVASYSETLTATFSKINQETAEMGHITDEENVSGKDDDEGDDDDSQSKVPLNIKDMAPSAGEVQMPPEPAGRCSKQLQERFAQYHERMLREGLDMNAVIQNQKQFRNPSIYEKLITFCQIDELGTNYSADIYDPQQFSTTSYYEDLAKAQKAEMDKRQKEQKERTKVEFISGTAKKLGAGDPASAEDSKKRKSKWDVGASQGVALTTLLKPASMISQPPGVIPLTAVATGTKAMVISAFGTIAKKSKQ